MIKHAIKVAVISFFIIVTIAVIGFASLAVVSPGKVAQIYDKTGFRRRAMIYAETDYEGTPTIDKLAFLVDCSIKSGDDEFITQYCNEFLRSPRLNEYLAKISDGNSYYDFIASSYIKSAYKISVRTDEEIVATAFEFVGEYRPSNAVQALMFTAIEHNDKEFLKNALLPALEEYGSLCPESALTTYQTDLNNLKIWIN